ncbi:glycoside hydrolase family 35 protein [Moniliophthora roreri MCA 2997]|uniref:beta-galactosidase n=1 Tax=Moniliophthora roreri (strain MCA 2997) TaxID=1381753 RepID=V2WWA3_MONRO|nr:glycoside hydrolase family 35 protein [Moniliophthora roreri MCA 2997]
MLSCSGVYTSYDYGSAITESRMLTAKFSELKLQSMFLRSSPEFYKTDWIGDTFTGLSEGAVISMNNTPPAFVTLLRNPDSGAGFWIVRQNDSTSTATATFRLNVTTADSSSFQLPDVVPITLSGRRSKVIVTDYAFGANSRALYSTAQIFFAGVIDGRDVLLLHGDSREEHLAAIRFTGTPNPFAAPPLNVRITASASSNNETLISFLEGIEGLITVYDSDTQLILFADSETVKTFWSPIIATTTSDLDPFANFWSFGTNQSILVGGPYLVRTASISDSGELALRGDLNVTEGAGDVMLSVIAPKSVSSISWNGQSVSFTTFSEPSSIITAIIPGPANPHVTGITIPQLSEWKSSDSLPEIRADFDDSSWVEANHTTTNIPAMLYGDGRVLYPCDYGFCENIVLYRGHFNGTADTKSVNLSINGGEAFAASVWLNDVFLNTTFGNSTVGNPVIIETDQVYTFPEGVILEGEDNVITIVQDNMGFDEAEVNSNSMKTPRGVRGFKLNKGEFTTWKVQGKIGGYTNFPDKVRGVLNEGGTFGERKGWHLPGFDTSSWETRNLSEGLPGSQPGVGFFVNTFELNIPAGNDVMLSFTFEEKFGQPYRAYLFVNGWMMGKRIGNIGPQAKFPVHQGILDYNGRNTVAVALWAKLPNVTVAPQLSLTLDGVFEGGVGVIKVNNPVWSSNGRE